MGFDGKTSQKRTADRLLVHTDSKEIVHIISIYKTGQTLEDIL